MERIYVPYFQNDTYYRGLEEKLTDAVIARINERSDLYLVDRDCAEMILEGRITDYKQRVLSQDRQNRVLESSALTTVSVKLVRARDGKVIGRATFSDRAEFFPGKGESLETSQQESFRVLAYRIVSIVEKGF